MEIKKLADKLEEQVRTSQKEVGNETEWEDEIENLQARDVRRGSNASQNHGCCMDPVFQQQLALFHCEINEVCNAASCGTSQTVHVPTEQSQEGAGTEWDEKRRSQPALNLDRQYQRLQ